MFSSVFCSVFSMLLFLLYLLLQYLCVGVDIFWRNICVFHGLNTQLESIRCVVRQLNLQPSCLFQLASWMFVTGLTPSIWMLICPEEWRQIGNNEWAPKNCLSCQRRETAQGAVVVQLSAFQSVEIFLLWLRWQLTGTWTLGALTTWSSSLGFGFKGACLTPSKISCD